MRPACGRDALFFEAACAHISLKTVKENVTALSASADNDDAAICKLAVSKAAVLVCGTISGLLGKDHPEQDWAAIDHDSAEGKRMLITAVAVAGPCSSRAHWTLLRTSTAGRAWQAARRRLWRCCGRPALCQ